MNIHNISAALAVIIPLLEKRELRWVITTGFACYLHGVERVVGDIDIDVDASKDDPGFQSLLTELGPAITSPLKNFIDDNYDNWNFEATLAGVIVDICTMPEMKTFNLEHQDYRLFYQNGFPPIDWIEFEGFRLPVQIKQDVLREKESRIFRRDVDVQDIAMLKQLLADSAS